MRAVKQAIKAGSVTTRVPLALKSSKEAPATKTAATTAKFNCPVKAVPSLPKKTAAPILSEGPPVAPFPGGGNWPEGWVEQVCTRTSGATAGQLDLYWIPPGVKFRLRSILDVGRWIQAMEISNGDEAEAKKVYKREKIDGKRQMRREDDRSFVALR